MLESNFIGKSSVIKKLNKDILRLGKLQEHIFVFGEKGTGKTALATLLHSFSKRDGRLVTINPTASSGEEIRSFLEKEPKNIGTIVFQDIQDFSFLYQGKINFFLQNLPKKPFAQIIITSKNSLDDLKADRKMIDDLYATVKKFEQINIPPLRNRREDIPLLVEHFIKAACESMNIELKALDVNILDFLVRREWAGNVSELKSVVESTVFTSKDGALELPENLVNEQLQLETIIKNIKQRKTFSFDFLLSNLEKTLIEKTLNTVDHNQTRAAEILNLSEANLCYIF